MATNTQPGGSEERTVYQVIWLVLLCLSVFTALISSLVFHDAGTATFWILIGVVAAAWPFRHVIRAYVEDLLDGRRAGRR